MVHCPPPVHRGEQILVSHIYQSPLKYTFTSIVSLVICHYPKHILETHPGLKATEVCSTAYWMSWTVSNWCPENQVTLGGEQPRAKMLTLEKSMKSCPFPVLQLLSQNARYLPLCLQFRACMWLLQCFFPGLFLSPEIQKMWWSPFEWLLSA